MQQQRVASLERKAEENETSELGIDDKISRLEQKLNQNIQIVENLVQSLRRRNRECYQCGKLCHISRICRSDPKNVKPNETDDANKFIPQSRN